MAFYRKGIFRIREVFNFATGIATEVNVPVCYTNLTINPGLGTEDIENSCTPGIVVVPTSYKPEWTIEFPPNTVDLSAINGYLNAGTRISWEFIHNPFADIGMTTATASNALVITVVTGTLVTSPETTQGGASIGRRRVSGSGGNWYDERVGRTGFPDPFDAASVL